MKRLLTLLVLGLVVGALGTSTAEAGDRHGRGRYVREAPRANYRDNGHFRGRDVVVIRDYYRPYYRPVVLPRGVQRRYVRAGYLPPGWAHRIHPVPVYIERQMVPVPRGYRRGVIDGRAVIYDNRGFILDVAVLF